MAQTKEPRLKKIDVLSNILGINAMYHSKTKFAISKKVFKNKFTAGQIIVECYLNKAQVETYEPQYEKRVSTNYLR